MGTVTNGFSSKLQPDSLSSNAKMEVRLNISAALVSIVLVGWAHTQECVPLSDCPSLLALWRNRHRIPGRNVYQVSQTLREAHCGQRNNQPLVQCDEEEEEEEDNLVLDNLGARHAIYGNTGNHSCDGMIKLRHWNSNYGNVKTLRLRGGRYGNIQKLRGRTVFNVETHGTCCWKAYSDIRLQGASEDWQRVDEYPNIQPKSLKRGCNI